MEFALLAIITPFFIYQGVIGGYSGVILLVINQILLYLLP